MKSVLEPHDAGVAGREAHTRSAGWALASLSLAMLLPALGTSIANVALPTLAEAFGVALQQVQWVVLAYLLATTTLVTGVGRLGDLAGRRRLLLAGIFLFTLAFVGETVPKARAGSAMGLLGTMSAVGTALGPSLGGLLIARFGWPAVFFVSVPLGVLSLLLAQRFLPPDRRVAKAQRASFDYLGTLLLALTLAAYALAMTTGRGGFGMSNVALLAAAVAGAGLFALAETKAASPLIRLALVREPVLGAGFVMSTLVTTVVMATLVVGPFYLVGAFALDPADVGLAMSSGPLVAALTGVLAGRGVDRLGAQRMTIAGLTGMAAGCVALILMPTSLGVVGYVAPLVVVTAGYALFQTANTTAVMGQSQAEQRGVISGLLTLSRNLGLITGASVMGTLFALGTATAGGVPTASGAAVGGMRLAFAVAAALIAIALAIAVGSQVLARRDTQLSRAQEPGGAWTSRPRKVDRP